MGIVPVVLVFFWMEWSLQSVFLLFWELLCLRGVSLHNQATPLYQISLRLLSKTILRRLRRNTNHSMRKRCRSPCLKIWTFLCLISPGRKNFWRKGQESFSLGSQLAHGVEPYFQTSLMRWKRVRFLIFITTILKKSVTKNPSEQTEKSLLKRRLAQNISICSRNLIVCFQPMRDWRIRASKGCMCRLSWCWRRGKSWDLTSTRSMSKRILAFRLLMSRRRSLWNCSSRRWRPLPHRPALLERLLVRKNEKTERRKPSVFFVGGKVMGEKFLEKEKNLTPPLLLPLILTPKFDARTGRWCKNDPQIRVSDRSMKQEWPPN